MRLLKPTEVAEILQCSLSKLRGLPIRYIKVGGQRRYERADIVKYIQKSMVLPIDEVIKAHGIPRGHRNRPIKGDEEADVVNAILIQRAKNMRIK